MLRVRSAPAVARNEETRAAGKYSYQALRHLLYISLVDPVERCVQRGDVIADHPVPHWAARGWEECTAFASTNAPSVSAATCGQLKRTARSEASAPMRCRLARSPRSAPSARARQSGSRGGTS